MKIIIVLEGGYEYEVVEVITDENIHGNKFKVEEIKKIIIVGE